MADQQGASEEQSVNEANGQCVSNYWPDVRQFCLSNDDALELYKPECPICQLPMVFHHPEADYSGGEQCIGMVVTPCGHVVGEQCLKAWHNSQNWRDLDCPVCREYLVHECGHPVDLLSFEDRDDAQFLCIPQVDIPSLCNTCDIKQMLFDSFGLIPLREALTLQQRDLVPVSIHIQLWTRRDEYANRWDTIKLEGYLDNIPGITSFEWNPVLEGVPKLVNELLIETRKLFWQPDLIRFHVVEIRIGVEED